MIEKNIENYCDKIGCIKFNLIFSYIKGEEYLLDLELCDIEEAEEISNNIINLIEFYLSEFESGNDDKIF